MVNALGAFVRGALGVLTGSVVGPMPLGMLSGFTPGAIGDPPPRGTREQIAVYSQSPWIRAVVSRIADSVASTTWRLYVAGRPGQSARRADAVQRARGVARASMLDRLRESGELREISTHLFLDTWAGGNSYLTGHATRKVAQIHLETVGEALLLKERNVLGAVIGLWPLPPDWVRSTPTPSRRMFRMSYRGWQAEVPDTEVLWLADPNPSNPYGRGTGYVRALGDEIETDEHAARVTKQWFFNNMRPDFVVMPAKDTTETFDEPEVRRLELRWTQRMAGFWNRWKPMFLARYAEIHEFDKDFRSGQFVQIREHERDIILATWGIPPEILGVLENSNRATIEAADFLYQSNVIVPRLEFLRAGLQERLLPEYDPRLILDYDSPVPEDRAHRLEIAKASPWAREVDEWRAAQGLDPLAQGRGRVFIVPTNVRAVASPIDAQPVAGVAGPGSGSASGSDDAARGLSRLSDDELATLRRLTAKVNGALETPP